MIKIAICDDNREGLIRTRCNCLVYIAKKPGQQSRISLFEDSKEPLFCIEPDEMFDIMVLDIYMSNVTGVELDFSVPKKNVKCEIIFATSTEAHAIEAFSLNATHYLVKPCTVGESYLALDKAFLQVEKQNSAHIMLKPSLGLHKVLCDELLYTETQGHMQHVHLVDGRVLQVRMTSIRMYGMFVQERRFHTCGSTYIINLKKVKEITAKAILLDNRGKLLMPRRQYKTFFDTYTLFSLGGCLI